MGRARKHRMRAQHGRPTPEWRSLLRNVWRRRPVGASEGLIVPEKPGNAGGGKGPCFWDASEEGEKRRLA
jgi:hypothetical protein